MGDGSVAHGVANAPEVARSGGARSAFPATGLGFAAIVLWASTIAFGRSLTESLGTVTAACLVYLGGGVLSVAWAVTRRGVAGAFGGFPARYLVGCGALFVANNVTMYLAIGLATDRLQVVEVGLVNYLWPTLTVLASVLLLNARAGPFLIPGAAVGMSGIVLAMTQNAPITWHSFWTNATSNPAAYAFGLAAAVTWALYSVLSRRWGSGSTGGAVPMFLLATGLALLVMRLGVVEQSVWTARAGWELAFMIIAPTCAYLGWEYAMRRGDIVLVASASYITPLLSTLISVTHLGVDAGAKLWIGCALVVVGAVTCRYSVREAAG